MANVCCHVNMLLCLVMLRKNDIYQRKGLPYTGVTSEVPTVAQWLLNVS